MVTGQDHVRHLQGDVVEPLLPEVPIRLVDHRDITAERAALAGVLALRDRRVVALWVITGWQLGASAVVADVPVAFAVENPLVPICDWSVCVQGESLSGQSCSPSA